MKVLSLKLKENIFEEVEKVVHAIHMPRNAYINDALSFYNQLNQRALLKKKLRKESGIVQESSLRILSEFEKFEDDLPS